MKQSDLKDWPKFLKHIRKLNKDGYRDYDDKDLGISLGFGAWDPLTEFVVVSTTEDYEICAVGFATKERTIEHLSEREGTWDNESVWYKDRSIPFRVVLDMDGK